MSPWQVPFFVTLVVSLATAVFAWLRRGRSRAARAFVAIPASHALWTALEILSLATTSLNLKLFLAGCQWLAGLGMVAGGLWFACAYTGRRFRWETWGWLLVLPLPLIFMWLGEPIDHRLHPEAWVRAIPPPSSLEYAFGPAEVGLITYGCLLSLVAAGLILSRLVRARPHVPGEMLLVVGGVALPPLAGVVSLALGLRWRHQRDTMPLIFAAADLVVALGLFRRRTFVLSPLAIETVVDGMTDGVVICDPDGRIVDLNPAVEKILGLPTTEMLGAPAARAFADWPALVDVCQGLEAHREMTLDERPPPPPGAERVDLPMLRWLDLIGTPVRDWRGRGLGVATVLRDITAWKRATDRRFRAVFDHSVELVALLAPDGTVVEVNQTALRFGGARRESIVGRPLWQAPWWSHSPTLRDDLQAALRALTDGEILRFEATHLRCDARTRYFDFSLTALAGEGGATEYVIAEGRDVTELLKAEKENAALAEGLARARRLEMVGRMSAAIAHDFNNLLVAVMGSAQVVKQAVRPGSAAAAGLDVIERAADSGAQLVRQIMSISGPGAAPDRAIDVGMALTRAAALIQPLVGPRIAVKVQNTVPLWPVRIDSGQLEQVLLNLAANARDALPGGGALWLSAENVSTVERRAFQGNLLEPGRYVLLRVRDDGAGMDDVVMEHALEPFFTTKTGGRGTGLGLSVVYGIVHGNGGFVEVRSSPGAGTTVDIYLPPADTGQAGQEHGAERPLDGVSSIVPATPRACIMVIEDEQPLRAMVRDELTSLGHEVHVFSEAASAEAAAQALKTPPSLLIADFVLPDATGLAAAEALRRRWPALKVLFLSAFAAAAQRRPEAPDVHFLAKPLDRAALLQTVGTLLAAT
jgi:PAS domain S-box-containing protein